MPVAFTKINDITEITITCFKGILFLIEKYVNVPKAKICNKISAVTDSIHKS